MGHTALLGLNRYVVNIMNAVTSIVTNRKLHAGGPSWLTCPLSNWPRSCWHLHPARSEFAGGMHGRDAYLQCDAEPVYSEAEDEDREGRCWCCKDVCNHLRDGPYDMSHVRERKEHNPR